MGGRYIISKSGTQTVVINFDLFLISQLSNGRRFKISKNKILYKKGHHRILGGSAIKKICINIKLNIGLAKNHDITVLGRLVGRKTMWLGRKGAGAINFNFFISRMNKLI